MTRFAQRSEASVGVPTAPFLPEMWVVVVITRFLFLFLSLLSFICGQKEKGASPSNYGWYLATVWSPLSVSECTRSGKNDWKCINSIFNSHLVFSGCNGAFFLTNTTAECCHHAFSVVYTFTRFGWRHAFRGGWQVWGNWQCFRVVWKISKSIRGSAGVRKPATYKVLVFHSHSDLYLDPHSSPRNKRK